MKIGVFGGTFDPVHLAHIMIADEVKAQLELAEVIFVPAGQSPLKINDLISDAEHRVQMVRLAIADYPYFQLSTIDIERPAPSYTIDTITGLRDEVGADEELYFIVGWDSLVQLPRWKDISRMIKMCQLVAVPRPGYSLPDLSSLEITIPGLSRRLIILDKPEIDISATEIRKQVAQGLSIHNLVPDSVAEYIKQHKLYLS